MNSRCQIKPSRPVSLQPDLAMTTVSDGLSASEIAQAVRGRKLSALDVIEAALARIAKHDPILNSFTHLTADRARAQARAVGAPRAARVVRSAAAWCHWRWARTPTARSGCPRRFAESLD